MKLSIASWNINDIFHKPDFLNKEFKTVDPEFKKYISKHDIIGISETKVGKSDKINIEGYRTEQVFRKQSKNHRYFGGICIAIKDEFLTWAFTKNVNQLYIMNGANVFL